MATHRTIRPAGEAMIDEEARRRFEMAWIAASPLSIESCLPVPESSLYVPTLEELVAIELEFAWKAWGQDRKLPRPALLESYLTRFPALKEAGIVRRLAREERRVRGQSGDEPAPNEYRDRFPDIVSSDEDLASTVAPRGKRGAITLPELPGYAVEAEIAHGAMGVVFRARDLRLNRPVAIKMILAGQYHAADARVRFMVEAEAVAALDHPYVVGLYEFGTHDDLPFFALEYVGGGTLAQKLAREGKLPPRPAATLVVKLAEAIAAAHARGIVHRDLKPGNVLLTEAGEPKVADFGLARVGQSEMTTTGAVIGTPSYMSPEQAGRFDPPRPRNHLPEVLAERPTEALRHGGRARGGPAGLSGRPPHFRPGGGYARARLEVGKASSGPRLGSGRGRAAPVRGGNHLDRGPCPAGRRPANRGRGVSPQAAGDAGRLARGIAGLGRYGGRSPAARGPERVSGPLDSPAPGDGIPAARNDAGVACPASPARS
jgi:tRNA A-37 threonylcarbamoyl transferase component Bud32